MICKTASAHCSTANSGNNAREAVRILHDAFKGFTPVQIVFFASTHYDPDVLAAEMFDAFPGTVTFGCTSAGEGKDDAMFNGSVVAMAFGPDALACCETALVLADKTKAKALNRSDVFFTANDASRYLARNIQHDLRGKNQRDFVCFMLSDQISDFSEGVIERVGDLNDVMLVGAFAGDDYKFDGSCRVMYQGKAYKNAVVLTLWKPKNGYSLVKTQAVNLTTHSAIVTKADETKNIVWELDGKNAADVYAEFMNIPAESMDVLDYDENPWASTVNDEPFLRAVMEKIDDKGLRFNSRVREGTRLTMTKAGDILTTTKDALNKRIKEMDSLSAILHINCVSRHTAMRKWGQLTQYATLFAPAPSISIASYGEIYITPIAMTSTILLFK